MLILSSSKNCALASSYFLPFFGCGPACRSKPCVPGAPCHAHPFALRFPLQWRRRVRRRPHDARPRQPTDARCASDSETRGPSARDANASSACLRSRNSVLTYNSSTSSGAPASSALRSALAMALRNTFSMCLAERFLRETQSLQRVLRLLPANQIHHQPRLLRRHAHMLGQRVRFDVCLCLLQLSHVLCLRRRCRWCCAASWCRRSGRRVRARLSPRDP